MITLTRPIAWLDIESTGVDPVHDQIIELAVVVQHPDGTRKEWCRRFNPGCPIPSEATAVHGITDADVADAPPFASFAARIHAGLQGKDLGGYNLRRMDLPMLDEHFRRHGMKLNLDGVRIIDCYGIFAKMEGRKLTDAIRKYCGREHEGAHGALADTIATADVFAGQIAAYPEMAAGTIDEIASFSQVGDQRYADLAGKLVYDSAGDMVYNFGKSKGVRVKDDPGFGWWMCGKDFAGNTLDVLRTVLR